MPDRLSELVRQRALVSEHLAWLDREIANAASTPSTGVPSPTPPTPPAPATEARKPSAASGAPAIGSGGTPAPEPEVILDQYRVTPAAVKQDVQKGCLLYFAAAFVLLGIVVVILYFAIGTRE